MVRHQVRFRRRSLSTAVLGPALAICLCGAGSSRADTTSPQAFHLVEINKLLVGYNGDLSIQALELKMITSGENFVGGGFIAVYDSVGNPVATLGTFPGNLPNGLAGDRILCATEEFASAFSITPDLVITPEIPMATGQVSFEKIGCPVNSLAYGNVMLKVPGGSTSAPPLPPHGATALVRTVDNSTFPSCPQAEDAAARFQLRGAGTANRHVFQNNARDTAQVWTTITSVEAEAEPAPPAPAGIRATPNPFTATTRLDFTSVPSRITIFDSAGRVVRRWSFGSASGGERMMSLVWDGLDQRGHPAATGLYFLLADLRSGVASGRVLLLR